MRIVVVMDPPSTIIVDEDTTFALMLAAEARGHRVDICQIADLYLRGDVVGARVRRARAERDPARPLVLDAPEDVRLRDVDVVFMRKDPPFDDAYLWATQLFEHVRGQTLLINDPRALRDANEKLITTHFAALMPPTLVSASRDRIHAFVEEVGGVGVLKPLDGRGGEGIFKLTTGDGNFNAIVEHLTRFGTRLAMAQAFVPEIKEGDKRILLLDGEPLGAILRIPTGADFRGNIHVGGRVAQGTINDRDRAIIAAVAPTLKAMGLVFVGLDVIGPYLTEINVTSPTGIQQMSRLDGVDYEARVIRWLEDQLP
jgi:glutathione synthase